MNRELKSVYFYHVDRQEWVEGPSLTIGLNAIKTFVFVTTNKLGRLYPANLSIIVQVVSKGKV